MTPKELQQLASLRSRIAGGSFTETDVSALLIVLRNHIGDGPLRELSHHMAHNERDRGRFFQRILANKTALDNLGQKPGKLVSGDVFTAAELGIQLNRALKQVGLPPVSDDALELVVAQE